MKWKALLAGLGLFFSLNLAQSHAQPPTKLPGLGAPTAPTGEEQPKQQVPITNGYLAPTTVAPQAACPAPCAPRCRFTPIMFGDLPYVEQDNFVPPQSRLFPIATDRGAFKIAENEAVLPMDRVFTTFNYYNNIRGPRRYVYRETVGFEKTIFNENASIGLRLPFFQVGGENNTGGYQDIGDLTAIFKFVLLERPNAAVSTGIAVTAPTGPLASIVYPDGTEVHSTLLQPYVGYLLRSNNLFLHGFSSALIPTDSRDVTVLFNDVGVGYWWARGDGLVSAIVPTFEAHVSTPVNHRSATDVPRFRDGVNLTAGTSFIFRRGSSLGIAGAMPVTGPRLFDFEVLANFNYRY